MPKYVMQIQATVYVSVDTDGSEYSTIKNAIVDVDLNRALVTQFVSTTGPGDGEVVIKGDERTRVIVLADNSPWPIAEWDLYLIK